MLLTGLGLIFGILLSFRYTMLILIPVLPLGWIAVLLGGLVLGSSGSAILIAMVLATAAIQAGYVAGVVLQWVLHAGETLPKPAWDEEEAVAADRAYKAAQP